MVTKHERFAALRDAPSNSEVTRVHNLLTGDKGFFIDRETIILLMRREASCILRVPIERSDVGDLILGDLITREEIREWGNLPETYKPKEGNRERISLLSVFEYMLRRDGGIVESPGKFPLDSNQVALQKDVLSRILAQVPDWETRFFRSIATLIGPTPPGVGL